ncbi:MAG: hypothetical protein CMI00_10705 [Oceanospirillaceae bacterium]|nr:hypothetical protein [Oceanospirillaceae bacterium]|tara:strand:- start:37529 stop:38707 length:1179 start_codon:yes stop_codon:yes gene_type:complete
MLDSALVYILLLVGVAVGWTLGQRFASQGRKSDVPDWIPSIDYLLSQTSDKSLEKFLSVEQLDDDAIDLLLKLGRSLRDKGELDKATHLHQKLFARPDLERSALQAIQMELALDYSSAGLLDRAEKIFRQLSETKGRVSDEAVLHLIELLEEEGEWRSILNLYSNHKLPPQSGGSRRVSHAACELAEQALKASDFQEVLNLCRQALKINPTCARASVIQGNMAYGQKEYREAIRCYLRASELDQQSVIRTLESMVSAFRAINDQAGLIEHLTKQWHDTRYVPALIACIETLAAEGKTAEATESLLRELSATPSNQGFLSLAELVITHRQPLDKSQLMVVYDILRRIVSSEPKYHCAHCGFKAQEPYWRCPSCKEWSTVKAFVPQSPEAKIKL